VQNWRIDKSDGRSLSHSTLAEIRKRAVQRVIQGGESPEQVVKTLGFHRSVIYEWLARFRKGGMAGLEAVPVPGRPSRLKANELRRLVGLIVGKNPLQLRFKYGLWTRAMIQELIYREFGVSLSESAVGRLLRRLGFTPQRPRFRAYQQDPEAVRLWLEEGYPEIQRLARQEGATIYFGDESGIRSDYHSGTTWAPRGKTPVVTTSGARFGLNMISAISAKGLLRFMVVEGKLNGSVFVEFLKRLLHNHQGPVFLIVDGHPAHRGKLVSQYVASTEGRLRLFFLPGYSPELNPDELVWRHVKHHNLGRQTLADAVDLHEKVLSCLHRLQKLPSVIRGFFHAPTVRYAL
jgi:transposase